jgi:hypothetical protein
MGAMNLLRAFGGEVSGVMGHLSDKQAPTIALKVTRRPAKQQVAAH